MVEVAPLDIGPGPAAAFTGNGDGWLGADLAAKMARLAVAAWARAVNGDGATLSAIADPDVAHYLLNPVRKDWVVAPGAVVTGIEIWGFGTSADVRELDVKWWFTGRQRHSGAGVYRWRAARLNRLHRGVRGAAQPGLHRVGAVAVALGESARGYARRVLRLPVHQPRRDRR